MRELKFAARAIALIALLLSASYFLLLASCGAFKPLPAKDEVLSSLSERYGMDFVIVETVKCRLHQNSDSIERCKLYLMAPATDQEHTFWVHSQVRKYGGLFLTYSSAVGEDTFTFDYFLEQFDQFALENNIHIHWDFGSPHTDLQEYLAAQHLQGGGCYVYLTEETSMDIVENVLTFLEELYAEYPYRQHLDGIRLVFYFCDESMDAEEGWLDMPSLFPYDEKANFDIESPEEVYEELYGAAEK